MKTQSTWNWFKNWFVLYVVPIILLMLFLLFGGHYAHGQTNSQAFPQDGGPYQSGQIYILPQNAVPQVPSGSALPTTAIGSTSYYYWVVTNDVTNGRSSIPAGPFFTSMGPAALSATASIKVQWADFTLPLTYGQASAGATPLTATSITYDILETSSSAPPTGTCTCAVAVGIQNASAVDTGTYSAYAVVVPAWPANFPTRTHAVGIGPRGMLIDGGLLGAGYTGTVFDPMNPIYAGGAKADVIIVNDASLSTGSGIVTTTANDPPFVCAVPLIYPCSSTGDVGKIIFATNQTGGGSTFYQTIVVLPQGTITTVTDAHHVVVSTTATQTTTGALAWGHDDTAAIQAAKTAADNAGCKAVQLPAATMFFSNIFTNGTHPCANTDWMSGQRIGTVWLGFGMGISVLVPLPSMIPSGDIFSHVGYAKGFTLNGLGNSAIPTNPTFNIMSGQANSIFEDVQLIGYAGATTHATGFKPGGTSSYILNSQCDGSGGTGINIVATFTSAWGLSCGDVINDAMTIGPTGIFDDHGSTYFDVGGGQPVISVQGNYSSDGAQWVNSPIAANGASLIQVLNNGIAHITKLNQAKQQSSGTNVNVFRVLNGGTLYLSHVSGLQCNSSPTCTGFQIDAGGTGYADSTTLTGTAASLNNLGTFNDLGGNTYSTPVTGTGSVFFNQVNTFTVATLPASPLKNTLATVTDGSGISCTSGGGTSSVLCRWTGSAWTPVGSLSNLSTSILAYSVTTESADTALTASTLTVVNSHAVTFPASGCPCRVLINWNQYLTTTGSSSVADLFVTDGTVNFAEGEWAVPVNNGVSSTGSGMSPSTYANNANVTFSVKMQIDATGATARAASFHSLGMRNSRLEIAVIPSN